jgi:hypothetical protein
MIGQFVANLLIPGAPQTVTLNLPAATWELKQHPDFSKAKKNIEGHQCAETYFLTTPVSLSGGSAAFDAAFDELTPIFLAASYATGLTVTSRRSTMMSEVKIMSSTEHWPRARAMDQPSFVVASDAEFAELVERFVQAWPSKGVTEKARLLVHHWLDALVCWSMEDLYLSATTLLQVIVASEATRQGKRDLPFYDGVEAAANHFGLRVLSADFKNMRNELIHDGQLIGRRFPAPDKAACAVVIVDLLNWLDEYIHSALALGPVRKTRFSKADLMNLNAYSIG